MMLTAIETIDGVERDDDRHADHRIFQDQIIQPVSWKRRVRTFHEALPCSVSSLVIVVLANHSPPSYIVLRPCPEYPRFSKKPRPASPASTVISLGPQPPA